MQIPMSSPDLTAVERDAVARVLATTHLSIGPRLDAFERAVAGIGILPIMAYNGPCRIGGSRRACAMQKLDRITIVPDVCLGQPTIRGMRITVSVVLKMLASGKSVDDVLDAYPELEREDVYQAMQYAAWIVSDHIQRIPA